MALTTKLHKREWLKYLKLVEQWRAQVAEGKTILEDIFALQESEADSSRDLVQKEFDALEQVLLELKNILVSMQTLQVDCAYQKQYEIMREVVNIYGNHKDRSTRIFLLSVWTLQPALTDDHFLDIARQQQQAVF